MNKTQKNCLSSQNKKELKKIAAKYNFKNDSDLTTKIVQLPTAMLFRKKLYDNSLRDSERKKVVSKLTQLADKLQKYLRDDTPADLKKNLLEAVPDQFKEKGYNNINTENRNWSMFQFETDLKVFYRICLFAQPLIPVDRGGKKAYSLPKEVIFYLASTYHLGTGERPICAWCHIKEEYSGDFYEFLLDLELILNDLEIELGEYQTIGKYAVEAIRTYKQWL